MWICACCKWTSSAVRCAKQRWAHFDGECTALFVLWTRYTGLRWDRGFSRQVFAVLHCHSIFLFIQLDWLYVAWTPWTAGCDPQMFRHAFQGGPGPPWYLTHIVLTWTIWRAPTNASKWPMGFNSVFKGLINRVLLHSASYLGEEEG